MPTYTEKELERILECFNKVAPNARCPLCGKDSFGFVTGVAPIYIQNPYPDPWGIVPKDEHLPCVPLTCNTCGNMFLINIRTLGHGELDDLVTYKLPKLD